MDNSINFAMFIFLYTLITGIALVTKPNYFIKAISNLFSSDGQILIVAFMALMFGTVIVSFHGFYKLEWPVLITIIGWLGVLKGILYLLFEDKIKKHIKLYKNKKMIQVNGCIQLFIAAIFGYIIFFLNNIQY